MLTDPRIRRHSPHAGPQEGPHREAPGSVGRWAEGEGKMWARASIVVSMGKVGRGRVIKLRAGQFE